MTYPPSASSQPSPKTLFLAKNYRFVVLFATMFLAINMYVDRVAVGQLKGAITEEFGWKGFEATAFVSVFFASYALGQVPAAALGLRIGFRNTLALLLVAWSLSTIATGFATTLAAMLLARIALGITEAGAYPNSGALIRGWFPVASRGRANSIITLGGRLGWAIAQIATPILALTLGGWRAVLIFYGILGVVIAVPFFLLAKDAPTESPNSPYDTTSHAQHLPVWKLALEPNMLCFSLVQFMTNLGWVFLLYDLPSYLEQVMKVDKIENGFLSSIPAWISCIGMIFGGIVTDVLSKRFSIRLARSIPIASMMVLCAVSYLLCTQITSPLLFVMILSLMAIGVDFANPSIWAFSQDVGKLNAGKVMGWANMWGNLGAMCGPFVAVIVLQQLGWNGVFVVNALCFVIAAVAALGMNASKPVLDEASSEV